MFNSLIPYGWQAEMENALPENAIPGRILAEDRQGYTIVTPQGEARAILSGKYRYRAKAKPDYPAVGDWVLLSPSPGTEIYKVRELLPRKTKLSRKSAGESPHEQVLGANIDTLLIVTSLNQDFNIRRLERYLVLARSSGAQPVILLNKADLCSDMTEREQKKALLAPIALDTPIFTISALENQGLEPLSAYLQPGKTLALLGSSGVGKSTLLNTLMGQPLQRVQAIREDDARGRHTTIHRQIFLLPNQQGMILDSPGLRELQLWENPSGLETAFVDIFSLLKQCRFRDCRHDREPDCAIRQALETGHLDKKRWRSFLKLYNESLYLEQRKKRQREMENRIKAKNAYKRARQAAHNAYLAEM